MAVGTFRQRSVAFLVAVALAFALVSGYFVLRSRVASEGSAASKEDLNQEKTARRAITALGRLEPQDGVMKVAAPSYLGPSIVHELRIKEGDTVKRGQIIAVLDNQPRLEAAACEAKNKLKVAEVRVTLAKAKMEAGEIAAQQAEVNRLQAEHDFALAQYHRYTELFQSAVVSASDFDERRSVLESLAQKLSQAKEVLNNLRVTRAMEIQLAEAEREEATAALARAQAELWQATIRSPISGHVIEVYAHEGESADGRGIAAIGNTYQMYAVAEVYESDIPLVRIGQRASVSGPAIKGEVSGVVERIGLQVKKNEIVSTDPAVEADARIVKVKIRLDDSARVSAFTNMRVTCTIYP